MSIELQNGSKFVTALSILEIYNKELYKELGYSNLYDYTSDVFGMGKTNTNDYKNVALRFSKLDKNKNCLVIDERLKDYNFSQLNLLISFIVLSAEALKTSLVSLASSSAKTVSGSLSSKKFIAFLNLSFISRTDKEDG